MVSEQFGTKSAEVTLGWQDIMHMLHDVHIHVVPEPLTKIVGNSTVQLVVPYNVPHLVKSVATLCGRNTSDVITLHYGQTNIIVIYCSRITYYVIVLIMIYIVRCVHPLHLLVNEHLAINAKSTAIDAI